MKRKKNPEKRTKYISLTRISILYVITSKFRTKLLNVQDKFTTNTCWNVVNCLSIVITDESAQETLKNKFAQRRRNSFCVAEMSAMPWWPYGSRRFMGEVWMAGRLHEFEGLRHHAPSYSLYFAIHVAWEEIAYVTSPGAKLGLHCADIFINNRRAFLYISNGVSLQRSTTLLCNLIYH